MGLIILYVILILVGAVVGAVLCTAILYTLVCRTFLRGLGW